jgi:hypothetical protein
MITAQVIEGTTLRAHRILGAPSVGFAAFLDGTQESRVLHHLPGGIPIVHGGAAAVVRVRRNRRLVTWRHRAAQRLFAPKALVPPELWATLRRFEGGVVDTGAPEDEAGKPARHPYVLAERAVHLVQKMREKLEIDLAAEWCAVEHQVLFMDGGISGSERVATAPCVAGVVKSHRTLYVDPEALPVIFGLRRGERSSAFRITSPRRATVASWYLRLRDAEDRDPMWGLVRVEAAEQGDPARMRERADEVSRWVLAESAPLALPDARWDKMAYGVRDCEEFLRATR